MLQQSTWELAERCIGRKGGEEKGWEGRGDGVGEGEEMGWGGRGDGVGREIEEEGWEKSVEGGGERRHREQKEVESDNEPLSSWV